MAFERVVIVGASLAGLRAAQQVRAGGFEGTVTLVGEERHRPYDRPPLSKQLLAGRWEPEKLALAPESEYADLRLDERLGAAAMGLDTARRELRLADGSVVPYDGLIVATGAAPRKLPGQPDLDGIFTLRTLDDSLALRERFRRGGPVVVVGAGFIGAEVAATARESGCTVTLLEALSVPLERALPPAIGTVIADLHRERGVDLRCGVSVAGFEGNTQVEAVRLGDGARIPAGTVVVGAGVVPCTQWLEGSGLTLRDGVVCDERLWTGVDGVYAAGDVTRWYNPLFEEEMRVEHWTNAAEQGMVAAQNLLRPRDEGEVYAPVPFFWSDQYDVTLQYAGRARPGDEMVVAHGTLAERKCVALFGRAGRLVGVLGFNSARLVSQYRRLIASGAAWDEALAKAAG